MGFITNELCCLRWPCGGGSAGSVDPNDELWLNGRLAAAVGSDLSCECYRRTLYQPYGVHVQRNSAAGSQARRPNELYCRTF